METNTAHLLLTSEADEIRIYVNDSIIQETRFSLSLIKREFFQELLGKQGAECGPPPLLSL